MSSLKAASLRKYRPFENNDIKTSINPKNNDSRYIWVLTVIVTIFVVQQ